ncbi:MAG: RdgB/HAM1 family non-canonical purine NTP pyrophosphatase [Patescibacteria group bacterium]|nr:RdgB/HAM1 family non-canonical purine NTP pyrophosphatase [Patescibacteria group bacterium]
MLLLATRNKHKLKEYQFLLKDTNITLTAPDQVKSIPKNFDVQETGKTFQQNAILKAKGFGQKANFLTIADDTGLCIDYLNGQPGIKSARLFNRDFNKAKKHLLQLLKVVPKSKRTAQFVCALALFNPKTNQTKVFTGTAQGYITTKEIGNKGFHYDTIFYSKKLKKTYAQATNIEKNKVSHRTKAFKKLIKYIKLHPYG